MTFATNLYGATSGQSADRSQRRPSCSASRASRRFRAGFRPSLAPGPPGGRPPLHGRMWNTLVLFHSTSALRTFGGGLCHRKFDRGNERNLLDRLEQEGRGSRSLASLAGAKLVIGRYRDGRNPDPVAKEPLLKLKAGHFGHLQIDDQARRWPVAQ